MLIEFYIAYLLILSFQKRNFTDKLKQKSFADENRREHAERKQGYNPGEFVFIS